MNPVYGPTNPNPDAHQQAARRYVQVVELKPEREAEYREMHAEVWPKVVAAVKRANISNYSIHLMALGEKKYLVAYFEYTGKDPEADFATIAQDPTTRDKWWPITDDCQVRLAGTPDGEQWKRAEMVMHLP